jgi:transcriptional regulator of acetoin/glycerol metabolism
VRLLHGRWLAARGQPATPLRLTAEAAERLLLGDWHDNLRGLDRFVHELAAREAVISAADLPGWIRAADHPSPAHVDPAPPQPAKLPPPTREELAETLARLGGSVRATAKHYRRDRRQIYRWLDAFGLKDRAKD